MNTITRDRNSIEYLNSEFDTFTVNGAPVTPPSNYELSATPVGATPTDWHPAPWLAGPFTPGTYIIRLRFTDTPEIPVHQVARLIIT